VPFDRNLAPIQGRRPVEWRRGRDYSALRASPLRGPLRALSPRCRCRDGLNENDEN
jgi:hypothetical protein